MKIIRTIIIGFLSVITLSVSAQQIGNRDVLADQLAGHLLISKTKAKAVVEAMDFNKSEIDGLIRDQQIEPKEKNKKLNSLIAEQQLKLKSVLDSSQIKSLMAFMRTQKSGMPDLLSSMKKRNDATRQKQDANKVKRSK